MDELGPTLRAAYPQALATLTRLVGQVDVAEDALQDAALRAVATWREQGVPDLPAAWLVRTARNRLIDLHRKRKLQHQHEARLTELFGRDRDAWSAIETDACEPVKDDLLRLVFMCCHPELPEDDRIVLTLRAVGGLTVEEIASAFLISDRAMEQRLTRAKRRIREAAIPYTTPEASELRDRLDSVLAVVYLVFNEGYKTARGAHAMRLRLAREAIRIGRLLVTLFRDDPEVAGLLSLMLLHHSRAKARLNDCGEMIPLDEQDRSLWDRSLIAEGRALLDRALRAGRPGPYQIQAAIAAVHTAAVSADETDWVQIAALYRMLERRLPTPVVRLNRAVAVARAEGPEAALSILASIETVPAMQRYHHFHVVLGELCAEVGDVGRARMTYARALELAANERERSYIRRRLAELEERAASARIGAP
jgi:RNA polymerase sigma-70 factor (ECF subfamily)